MKIAPQDVSALLQTDRKYQAFLYGHDNGLVRERAKKIAFHFTKT